jgi:ethanolamine utilization protein EutN
MVEPYRLEPPENRKLVPTGRTFVAVDTLGTGVGDFVLITQGSSARFTPETNKLPIDAVIIGIVDQVHIEKACVYHREGQTE